MTESPDLRPLFPGERAALLELLADLSPGEWAAPTACSGWSVQDVAAHLLGDDIGRLSRGRDGFANPDFATGLDIATLPGLIAAIDRQNARWVEGMRRVSPRLLIDLLRLTGEWTEAYFARLDLHAIGASVDWAGPEPAPVWLDVAREYTERWVHQQHIRDAIGRVGLKERRWLGPVLATFTLALPRALADHPALDGASLRLVIAGEAGGTWTARREGGRWILDTGASNAPTAAVEIDQEIAWRLFTKGLPKDEAERGARIAGDADLAARVFEMVAILA
ncbi:MAG: maleylpyruvate isomerase family mycothiol-dependent enzyme [Thermomicrobiales bacterium]|nr:maleylpyruvate isomerase family mycothiol-dependent enzyme [Thermomicrobiales bacterium]